MSEFCCWLFHSHNFIMYRNAWEKGKKGKTVGSVPVTCVRFTARVWPVPSAGRLQGLFGPRVSFYWGVLRSSVLAWRIPGTGEPGGPPSMGSHRVGHDWSDLAAALRSRRVMQPVQSQAFITEVSETSWVLWWQAQGPAQDFLVMRHPGFLALLSSQACQRPKCPLRLPGSTSHPIMHLCLFSLF